MCYTECILIAVSCILLYKTNLLNYVVLRKKIVTILVNKKIVYHFNIFSVVKYFLTVFNLLTLCCVLFALEYKMKLQFYCIYEIVFTLHNVVLFSINTLFRYIFVFNT